MFVKANPEVKMALPSDREIAFTAILDHPSSLVFKAWTDPEHIRHWWGCEGSTLTLCQVDLRIGGAWCVTMRMADGSEHPFNGTYREIVPDARLVYDERYENDAAGNPEWLTTITFDDLNGRTRLSHTILHKSKEVRDAHLKAGMEAGTIQTLHRLADRVAQMAEGAAARA
jgi:uncharacterized protein YndB with AHSA1/START domain